MESPTTLNRTAGCRPGTTARAAAVLRQRRVQLAYDPVSRSFRLAMS